MDDEGEDVHLCERCAMRAPPGARHCATCARVLRAENDPAREARAVIDELARGQAGPVHHHGAVGATVSSKAAVAAVLAAGVAAVVLGAMVRMGSRSSLPPTSLPTAAEPAPATKSAEPAQKRAACDAHSLWFDGTWAGTPEENQAAMVRQLKVWNPDCRAKAFESECERGCDDFLTGMLLQAVATPEEARALTQVRHDRNTVSVRVTKTVLDKVRKFATCAASIVQSPRMSAYRKPGESAEEIAERLVAGNPCLDRMKIDFATIRTLKQEVEANLPQMPEGSVCLLSGLSRAMGCVDCTDDRSGCVDMREDLRNAEDLLRDREKLVTQDKLHLGRAPLRAPTVREAASAAPVPVPSTAAAREQAPMPAAPF